MSRKIVPISDGYVLENRKDPDDYIAIHVAGSADNADELLVAIFDYSADGNLEGMLTLSQEDIFPLFDCIAYAVRDHKPTTAKIFNWPDWNSLSCALNFLRKRGGRLNDGK